MNIQDCIKNRVFIPALCGISEAQGGRFSVEDIPIFDWTRIARLSQTPNNSVSKVMQSLLNGTAMQLKSIIRLLLKDALIKDKIQEPTKPIATATNITNTPGAAGTKRGISVSLRGVECKRDIYTVINLTDIKLVVAQPSATDFQIEIYEITNGFRNLTDSITVVAGTSGIFSIPDITTAAHEIQLFAPSEIFTKNTATACPSCPASRIDCLIWNNVFDNGTTVTAGAQQANEPTYGFTLKGVHGCDNNTVLCRLINMGEFDGLIKHFLTSEIITHIISSSILSEYTSLSKEDIAYHTQKGVQDLNMQKQAIITWLKEHRNELRTTDCLTCQNMYGQGSNY